MSKFNKNRCNSKPRSGKGSINTFFKQRAIRRVSRKWLRFISKGIKRRPKKTWRNWRFSLLRFPSSLLKNASIWICWCLTLTVRLWCRIKTTFLRMWRGTNSRRILQKASWFNWWRVCWRGNWWIYGGISTMITDDIWYSFLYIFRPIRVVEFVMIKNCEIVELNIGFGHFRHDLFLI